MGSHFPRLCVPKDLTAGFGKAAQMSVEEVLVQGEGEVVDYTERKRRGEILWSDRHR